MRVTLTSLFVDDQRAALAFYTEVLGFVVKHDVDMGEFAWLTVVPADDPDGVELLLEPSAHPAVGPYREALKADGIPLAQLQVDDLAAEHERLSALGVAFTVEPTDVGAAMIAVLDDTCGNLIQLLQNK